jgi:hypothetical protein
MVHLDRNKILLQVVVLASFQYISLRCVVFPERHLSGCVEQNASLCFLKSRHVALLCKDLIMEQYKRK